MGRGLNLLLSTIFLWVMIGIPVFAEDNVTSLGELKDEGKLKIELTGIDGAVPFDKQINVRKVGDKVRYSSNMVAELKKSEIKDSKTIQTWEAKISGLPETKDDLVTPLDTDWYLQEDGSIKTGDNLFEAVVNGNSVKVTYQGKSETWTPKVMVGLNEDIASNPIIINDLINENDNLNTIVWYYTSCTRYLRVTAGSIQESYVFSSNPNNNVQIFDNTEKDAGFAFIEKPVAFDANYMPVKLSGDKGIAKSEFNRTDITYPVTIDPTMSFPTSANDGYLLNASSGTYNTNWAATSSLLAYTSTTENLIGQIPYNTSGAIFRDALYFDTSTLLSAVTITDAIIYLYGSSNASTTDFDITVQNGQPTYPSNTLIVTDYDKSHYAGSGGTLNTSGWLVGGYNSLSLDATGISWINKGGNTKLFLRSSRDISGTAPSAGYNEYVGYATYEEGMHPPYFDVTYTAVAPSISTSEPSEVKYTTAQLNAHVDSDGGDVGACTVEFGYGKTSHTVGDYGLYTTHTGLSGAYSTGENPIVSISGLDSGTEYYYRAEIHNSSSTVVSTVEKSFVTGDAIHEPTELKAQPTSTTMLLSYVPGANATNTLIRYSQKTYPTSTTGADDSIKVDLSSSSSVSHTGLIPGSTYYYSLWGESGGDYSSSPISIVMTTLSNNYSNTGLLSLDDPTNKDIQNPDTTVLSKLGPFYSLINNFINSWGFTNGVGWAGLFAFLIVIIGLIVYVRSASISMALVVIVVCMVIGYFLHIFSWWWILFGALGMLGSFALPKREV